MSMVKFLIIFHTAEVHGEGIMGPQKLIFDKNPTNLQTHQKVVLTKNISY